MVEYELTLPFIKIGESYNYRIIGNTAFEANRRDSVCLPNTAPFELVEDGAFNDVTGARIFDANDALFVPLISLPALHAGVVFRAILPFAKVDLAASRAARAISLIARVEGGDDLVLVRSEISGLIFDRLLPIIVKFVDC